MRVLNATCGFQTEDGTKKKKKTYVHQLPGCLETKPQPFSCILCQFICVKYSL